MSNDDGMTLSALSAKTEISKSTIFPILKSLVHRKYISCDEKTGKYTLGISCAVLASSTFEKEYWLKMINSEMRKIVADCNEVCQMGVLDDSHVLYIDKVQSDQTVQLISKIGTRLPAIHSALGKALLYQYTDKQILELYPDGFKPLTSHSVADLGYLRRQLDDIAVKGYAVDDREVNEDTICFAVPLKQRDKILAAISVSLPYFRANGEKIKHIVELLISARAKIEHSLDNLHDINNY